MPATSIDEQEPETRAPRKMDEYKPAAKMPGEMNLLELAVEGISTGLRSIELSIKIMSTNDPTRERIELDIKLMRNSLMSLKKILAEQNGEEQKPDAAS